jgi:D-galactarolactone cycloisomerase
MKITDVKVIILKKDLATSMRISRGGFKVRRHFIVQVVTDEGIYGLGEGVGNPQAMKALVETCMTPMILGMDPTEIETIKHKLLYDSVYFERAGSWICAFAAIETALWDIKGKKQNCPIYDLIGGKTSDSLEVYASDVYWYEDTKIVAKEIETILEKGIKNVKIHTGVLPPKEEHKRLKGIESVLSGVSKFMIDLNCAYTVEDAHLAARLFGEFKPYWLEEPVKIVYEDRLHEVKETSPVPISWGENVMNLEGFHYLLKNKAFDFAMPDIARVGGISTSLKILELLEKFHVTTSFHNFSSGVLLAATMQIMAARKKTNLLEFDSSTNAVIHEFFPEGLKLKDGKMQLPKGPGLGVELTNDVLRFAEC